ncbi:HHE domain-containing protein [Coprinopsis marcescibilis]|uniref:HHE domain-containing protein n=1 Tax=Coprinopsis marcescibilis TaxID=230819 RepID=A0A5C3KFZ6_COPMA|nr:HHE domain-containing protein [Coprinopsis marcescibilis]
MSSPEDAKTLIETIKRHHREIESFYDEYLDNVGNPEAQKRWGTQLMWGIGTYYVAGELALYPIYEKELGEEGKQIVEYGNRNHEFVKSRLKLLESMKIGSEMFNNTLREIMRRLTDHMFVEESQYLPLIEQKIGQGRSHEAAQKFIRARLFDPTKNSPDQHHKHPFASIESLVTAPLEKLRDAFSHFPDEDDPKLPQAAPAKN